MITGFYKFMGRYPWPFAIILPISLVGLLIAGFTRDDIVEKDINNIWTSTSGKFYNNKLYLESLLPGTAGRQDISSFSAMAVSRDNGNLFTASRLEEITQRMKDLAEVTVDYNGNTFTFQDTCWSNSVGKGTTYKFACFRLSPMDLFQESRWTLDEQARLTWYNDLIYPQLVAPRLTRYGIVLDYCLSESEHTIGSHCDHDYKMRMDPDYAVANGEDPEYAETLFFFDDIGSFEENNECKICIETMLDEKMQTMLTDYTDLLTELFVLLSTRVENGEFVEEGLLEAVQTAGLELNYHMVEDFYMYYIARKAYAALGAEAYITGYEQFLATPLASLCRDCPVNITEEEAVQALYAHADNAFSSENTAGLPVPFWNAETGFLFDYRNTTDLKPFGGSGLDLSGKFAKFGDSVDDILNDPGIVWLVGSAIPMVAHCGNDGIPGSFEDSGALTAIILAAATSKSCTKYSVPFEVDGTRSKTHFARMWYNLVIDSPSFLNLVQGESDPYVYTVGRGCGYVLRGERFSYTGKSEESILQGASGDLYYIDEGELVGALDRNILIGSSSPPVGEYSFSNPLTTVRSLQNVYLTLSPEDIVKRVKNCNRPGGPIDDLTEDEAKEILTEFKSEYERIWSNGWDDPSAGEVQFVGFYDDVGATGTTARILQQVTLSGGNLMVVSFCIIALFSILFLFSSDPVESRIGVTTMGVCLIILSFFAALGTAILSGIKLNLTIGWTLPFILIGLGVDNMYIISLALKEKSGYEDSNLVEVMQTVLVPVTMTSLVNFCMFALMNISDIPAVYLTAQTAMIAVAFLWMVVIFCFPAFCFLDLRRQRSGRSDVICCKKNGTEDGSSKKSKAIEISSAFYEKFYEVLIIKKSFAQMIGQTVVSLLALALLALGIYGIFNLPVGLGLEELLPSNSQSGVWSRYRTETLSTWPIKINWGQLNYTNPEIQLKMISQFEKLLNVKHVASNLDTKELWIANFAIWTTYQCDANWIREDPTVHECGYDIFYTDGTSCVGTWKKNTLGLRNKLFDSDSDTCEPYELGVCRPTSQMHPEDLNALEDRGVYDPENDVDESWCPVFEGWSEDKLQYCVEYWRMYTGDRGSLLLEPNTASNYDECSGEFRTDDKILSPIKISSSPDMFGIQLFTHKDTVDLITETRALCDDQQEMHCFMTGPPYSYWEQYINIGSLLFRSVWLSVVAGFGVTLTFLFSMLVNQREHPIFKTFCGAFSGALLIAITCILSVITVIGISGLVNVSLTAFSLMSFILSTGFVVEYSVHITHRFITAPLSYKTSIERVEYAMSFLFLPTFMSFASSTIGVICLAFTKFDFTKQYFFRPLIIVMFVTYFFGTYFLPVLLTKLDFDFLKLGKQEDNEVDESIKDIKSSDNIIC